MFRGGNPQSFVAGAAVPQGRFVKLSSGKVIVAAAVSDDCIGVSLEAASAADATALKTISIAMIDGQTVVEVEASEAIVIDSLVGPTADGSARVADTAGDAIMGRALSAAAADGEFVSVLLQKQGKLYA